MAREELLIPNEPIPMSGVLGPDVEGFSVPTFSAGGRDYVQQVESGDAVNGFLMLDNRACDGMRAANKLVSDQDLAQIRSFKGDMVRYAFQFRDRRVTVLPHSDMMSVLKNYVAKEASSIAPLALVSVLDFFSKSEYVDPNGRRTAIGRARDWLLAKGVTQARGWEQSQLIRSGLTSSYENELNRGDPFNVDEEYPQQFDFQGVSFGSGNIFNHPYFVTWGGSPFYRLGMEKFPLFLCKTQRLEESLSWGIRR